MVSVFLMVFTAIIFFAPEFGGYFLEYNNFIPADPLKTPLHIAPVWYFTPFYSMLRAITTEMMYALMAIVLAAALFSVVKFKMAAILSLVMGSLYSSRTWDTVRNSLFSASEHQTKWTTQIHDIFVDKSTYKVAHARVPVETLVFRG
jgi:hypothetical protein